MNLISSGTSNEESAFLDASESGSDVFFLTTAKLLPQDYDNAYDIYDARTCTSVSPCFAPAPGTPPPCETSDSCKTAPTPQPAIFGAPASATFSGAGNLAPGSDVKLGEGESTKPGAPHLTRAQKLARALKACRKKRGRKRTSCVRRANALYGAHGSRKAAAKKGAKR